MEFKCERLTKVKKYASILLQYLEKKSCDIRGLVATGGAQRKPFLGCSVIAMSSEAVSGFLAMTEWCIARLAVLRENRQEKRP